MYKGHITDNHMHIDPINGLGLDAVKQFTVAGGTDIILIAKTARDWGGDATESKDFANAYEKTIDFADKVSKETDARAYPVVGFHPSEFIGLAELHGLQRAMDISYELMDVMENLFSEGRIYAIGEVGRPHFPVSDDILRASNEILCDFLRLSSRLDCPLQLHTENFNEEKFEELSKMIKRNGNPNKVIKHFSPPMPNKAQECGVFPSIVSSKDSIKKAISESSRFLMETDYIDDKTRPGAVLGPKTVPKRTRQFLDSGIFTEEDAAKIHEDNISYLYGISF